MRNGKTPPASPAGELATAAPGPVDHARVRTWPPPVRADVRGLLLRDITDTTSAALHRAVREITDVIDQVNLAEEQRHG